jgi:hypothetical protein
MGDVAKSCDWNNLIPQHEDRSIDWCFLPDAFVARA